MNNTGLVSGNAQNNATDKAVRTRSKFNMSYNHLQTARFGELNSHFVMEAVPSDVINLRSAHELRTYTLKAPLMQDIEIKKDYFSVPMEAILPLNWEKIYTNPTLGDDIDATQYGTSVSSFYTKVYDALKKLWDFSFDTSQTDSARVEALMRFCSLGNLFFSHGSLMSQLGYHYEFFIGTRKWDDFVNHVYNIIVTDATSFGVLDPNAVQLMEVTDDVDLLARGNYVNHRYFFDFIQNNSDWHFDSESVWTLVLSDVDWNQSALSAPGISQLPINIARVLAYQLCAAHYYSNDAVDYIYSAELYRQYIYSLCDEINSYISQAWYHGLNFTYNGVSSPVDYLSSIVFTTTINSYVYLVTNNYPDVNTGLYLPFYQYLQSVFGFKNSLRYLDYFTGSKTRPLAVGNVDANVVGGKVSIIDVTRNIQIQKFLNSVNRTGRKFSNYIEGLFGNKVAYDYHNPAYIAHTADKAVAYEVENTGTDQLTKEQSVTAIARSNASKFAFEFHCDRPSIVIGIFYFDIARNYSLQVDKQIYHVDRFDMFNPYLQFIGDQVVNQLELSPLFSNSPFGYQLRYAEYKQRVNQLDGGFVDKLPGYAFDASTKQFMAYGAKVVKPSFIRSHPWELDEFYLSLSYFSLDGYFHFIIKNNNDVEASRPMAFAPSIL